MSDLWLELGVQGAGGRGPGLTKAPGAPEEAGGLGPTQLVGFTSHRAQNPLFGAGGQATPGGALVGVEAPEDGQGGA